MSELTPLQKFMCPHSILTDADSEGYAICLSCGGSVVKHLTVAIFDKYVREALAYPRRV